MNVLNVKNPVTLLEVKMECRLCWHRICTDTKNGRIINDNNGKAPVDKSKISNSPVKIEDCEMKQTLDWFELEGKTDESLVGS